MNKKIIIISIILVIAIIFAITRTNKNSKKVNIELSENNTIENITLEEIEFKDIGINYEEGITTIKANVYNNTKETKSINVKITLKDENGNEIKTMIQIIENIEPNRKKLLQTGTLGDYTKAKDIQFEVLSDKEVEQYN